MEVLFFVRTLVPPEQVVLGVSQPGQLVDHPVVRDHLFSDMCHDKNDEGDDEDDNEDGGEDDD